MSDDQYRDHVSRLRSALNAAPQHAYTHNDNSPKRMAARQDILDNAWEELGGDNIPKGRQGLVLAGVPGSAKTTIRMHGSVPGIGKISENFLPIDADYFKGKIIDAGLAPSLPGFSPMEASPLMHKESNDLAKALSRRAYEQGTNLVWDSTLRHPHSADSRLSEFSQYGYTPHGIYAHVDPREAFRRVTQRHRDDLEQYISGMHRHGGRYVPPEILRGSLLDDGRVANREHYNELVPHLATSQIFDTGSDPMRRMAEFSSQPLNVTNDYSLAAFMQWCAHNHKQVDRNNLAEFAAVSGMDNENYLDIYLFLANSDGMFRNAAAGGKEIYNSAGVARALGLDLHSLKYYLKRGEFPSPTHTARGHALLWDDLKPWKKWQEKRLELGWRPPEIAHVMGGDPLPKGWAAEFKHDKPLKKLYTMTDLSENLGLTRGAVEAWYHSPESLKSAAPPSSHFVKTYGGKGTYLWADPNVVYDWYKILKNNRVINQRGGLDESLGQHDKLQNEMPLPIDKKPGQLPVFDDGSQALALPSAMPSRQRQKKAPSAPKPPAPPPPRPQDLICPNCFTQHAGECL